MSIRFLGLIAVIIPFLLFSNKVSSLTMQQFTNICHSIKRECSEHPILQAYVGGALDLIAVLNEETDYLEKKLYCKKPKELFNVADIIRFMEQHQKAYLNRNAMLLIIRYFEEKGGCNKL